MQDKPFLNGYYIKEHLAGRYSRGQDREGAALCFQVKGDKKGQRLCWLTEARESGKQHPDHRELPWQHEPGRGVQTGRCAHALDDNTQRVVAKNLPISSVTQETVVSLFSQPPVPVWRDIMNSLRTVPPCTPAHDLLSSNSQMLEYRPGPPAK